MMMSQKWSSVGRIGLLMWLSFHTHLGKPSSYLLSDYSSTNLSELIRFEEITENQLTWVYALMTWLRT